MIALTVEETTVNRSMRKTSLLSGLVLGLGLAGGTAQAVEVFLCADATTLTMPDGNVVTMWGYAEDDNANLADGCGNPVQVPGPAITVPSTDTTLTVNLLNNLPQRTSLVIGGQGPDTNMVPRFITDKAGRQRVYSFTHETRLGRIGRYTWNNFQPGSYAYQSGTHVAVQVQMGLYGAVNRDAAPGQGYPGVPYDQDVELFYSEIDPVLHADIAGGTYGNTGATSTIDYAPKYFLVNGAPYSAATTPLPAGAAGTRTLLRMYNMGLGSLAPTLLGEHLQIVAEDGSVYPYPREQYSVLLPAGKTRDAILMASADGTYPFYDRRLNLVNAAAGPGGIYSYLEVGTAGSNSPQASDDLFSTAEDTLLTIPAPGVLGNDTGNGLTATQVSAATAGTAALAADGSFTYTAPADYNGMASFTYTASDGVTTSNTATVSVNVTPVNDAPVTVADSYSGAPDTALFVAAPGVLANDTDVDGDTLRAVLDTGTTQGTVTLFKKGGFRYIPNPGFNGVDSFTYHSFDGTVNGNTVQVTLTIAPPPNQPPIAVDDTAATPLNTFVRINAMANDSDPDGALDWTSLTIVSGPTNPANTATVNAKGNAIFFTPTNGFTGVETITYTIMDTLGAVSNIGTVSITVGP